MAQTAIGLERVNFFPKTDAFASFTYQYKHQAIETPESTLMTKQVNNHSNFLKLRYGHHFSRKFIAGVGLAYETASENGVIYGVPVRSRFRSQGFNEPELFLLYRLREQEGKRGMVDFHASYSPRGGKREVGNEAANRLNARTVVRTALSHGLWEDEWEFRTLIGHDYYGRGLEENAFTMKTYDLEAFSDFLFNFKAQYRIDPWNFIYGSIGFYYRSTQVILERSVERREIQAGTGSIFEAGIKKPLSKWSLVDFGYKVRRNEYFVKGGQENLSGEEMEQNYILTFVMAY